MKRTRRLKKHGCHSQQKLAMAAMQTVRLLITSPQNLAIFKDFCILGGEIEHFWIWILNARRP